MNFDGKLTPEMYKKLQLAIEASMYQLSGFQYWAMVIHDEKGVRLHTLHLGRGGDSWLHNTDAWSMAVNFATGLIWKREIGITWFLEKGSIMYYDHIDTDSGEMAIEEFYDYNPETKLFEFSGIFEDGKKIQKGYPDYFDPCDDAWEFEEDAAAYYGKERVL